MEGHQYIKVEYQISLHDIAGPLSSIGDRVLTKAWLLANPETHKNHKLVVSGWDEPYLAIEAERLETDRELKIRIAKEDRNRKAHEKWQRERDAAELAMYEKLKKKYG